MEILADWAVVIIVSISTALIGRFVYGLKEKHEKDYKELLGKCIKITERTIKLETKLDIYLDDAGFDIGEIDRAIKEHMAEIESNDRPTVGCLDIKSFYKEVKHGQEKE